VRTCAWLVVTVLVPTLALASEPASDESPTVAANIAVDLSPAPGVPRWFASSFEQTIARELAGFERLGTIAKQDVALTACGDDRACRLRAYRDAHVDIVLFGSVRDDAIDYELYQTWTPARLDTGTMDIGRGQSIVGLEHETRRAFHVVLKHGGLLDQKPYAFDRDAAAISANDAWSGNDLLFGLVLAALLALPFGLALLGGEAARAIARMRSARRVAVVIAVLALALIALDPRRLAALVAAWPCFVAGLGGLGWGALLVTIVRTLLPPLDGLERVPHGELGRVLGTMCLAALERLVVLAVVYVPLLVLVGWLGDVLAMPDRWTYLVLAPALVALARLWFGAWVECVAARLDRRIVEGPASGENPWSREVSDYLIGYVRRTGWDLDPALLGQVIFLPGKKITGVVAYGGGPTRVRIVIDRELLVMTMGPLLDVKPDEEPALWPDWTSAHVGPRGRPRQPHMISGVHDFHGRKPRTVYPGMQRKPLGQAATLLGYVTPAPGQLVPLISDNPQDLAIVRELLSEHYPWFAPDPDEEYDATDPTDKDLLFGALVHALGTVRRNETQPTTLRLAFGQRIARLSTRVRARLADSYAALHFARHHLIQFLHHSRTGDTTLLTARARPAQLHETSRKILRLTGDGGTSVNPAGQTRVDKGYTVPRLAWLSRFFAERIHDRRGAIASRVTAGALIAALLAAVGIAVKRSIDYHPVYVDRMNVQQQWLEKGSADGEVREKR
jgi:hypothetical protein